MNANKQVSRAGDIEFTQSGSLSGSTDPVICLHGIGGDYSSFDPQLDALSSRYRTIAWCMPGYRGSTPLTTTSFTTLADALERFMDELTISSAHLIGQSIGGMVAQEFALSRPTRTRSLTLIATTSSFGGRDDSFKDAFLAARLTPLEQGLTMPELANAFIPEITGPRASHAAKESAIASMAAVSVDTYKNILQCLVTFNRRNDIQRLSCPVCLIAGSEDNNAPARTMQKMAQVIPDAEFHEIADAGHLINLEVPDETNRIVRHFLDHANTESVE